MGKYKPKFAKRKNNLVWIVVALLVAFSAVGFVAAKYLADYNKEAEIHASNFHFSSNYLQYDSEPVYTVSDWGDHNVQFCLYNYEQENIALISETDLTYQIDVEAGWSVTVKDGNGQVVTPNSGAYTMPGSEIVSHTVVLEYTGEGEPTSVNVTVKSTAPYAKEIKAKFNLSTKKSFDYTVVDKGDYCELIIETNNYYGTIEVTWPDGVSPDNTCEYMGLWRDASKPAELNALEYKTYTLIFVEHTAGNYVKENFTLQ